MSKLKAIKNLGKRNLVPSSGDPLVDLRVLMSQHKALTRQSVALGNMGSDRKLKNGDTIPNKLPDDAKQDLLAAASELKHKSLLLQTPIRRQLRQIPVYTELLAKSHGCGPIIAGYLLSEIDIHKCVKISALHRFAGMAVINGRLDRRAKGQKNSYNSELRTRLYQWAGSMRMQCGAMGEDGTRPITCKYVKIWDDYKHRAMHSERYLKKEITKGFIDSTGWHKAADIFLEDLYIVWRTMEGLPVWPSYYAAMLRGYEHGGKISVNAPRMLTVPEALELVGYVGSIAEETDKCSQA